MQLFICCIYSCKLVETNCIYSLSHFVFFFYIYSPLNLQWINVYFIHCISRFHAVFYIIFFFSYVLFVHTNVLYNILLIFFSVCLFSFEIGVYGDVQRVKILYNKKDSALIQMAEPHQAYLGKWIKYDIF